MLQERHLVEAEVVDLHASSGNPDEAHASGRDGCGDGEGGVTIHRAQSVGEREAVDEPEDGILASFEQRAAYSCETGLTS
jgi:hypothetical protein